MAKQTTLILDLVKEAKPLGSGVSVYTSERIDLDKASGQFCAQVTVKNAIGAEFKIKAELSVDGEDFVLAFEEDLTILTGDIITAITDPSGYTALFDFSNGSGAGYLRLKVEMVAGTVDLTRVIFKAKEIR